MVSPGEVSDDQRLGQSRSGNSVCLIFQCNILIGVFADPFPEANAPEDSHHEKELNNVFDLRTTIQSERFSE
jgi:hypothetical protein